MSSGHASALIQSKFKKLRLILKSPSKAKAMANQVIKISKPEASKNIINAIEAFLGEKNDRY